MLPFDIAGFSKIMRAAEHAAALAKIQNDQEKLRQRVIEKQYKQMIKAAYKRQQQYYRTQHK